MTQASLSTDLNGAIGASPSSSAPAHEGPTSEAALWMIAVTSSGLIVAALLMLNLLIRDVITDAALSGFVSGVGIVIALLGIGGVTYALVTARRAGYLEDPKASAATSVAPAGMHVVPAIPADMALRRRRQLEAEQARRNRQAKAIAAAVAVGEPRPAPPPRQAPPPAPPPRSAPQAQRNRVAPPAPVRATRPAPPRSAPVPAARPAPPRSAPAPAARPAPPRSAPVALAVSRPSPQQAPARPPITMPRTQARSSRPAAWPTRAPIARMPAPPTRPRTQVATFQVNAANVRATAPMRPW